MPPRKDCAKFSECNTCREVGGSFSDGCFEPLGLQKPEALKRTNELSCYEELVAKYDEYLAFLNDANEGPIMMAYAHGWRCSPRLVDKGREFRVEIERLKLSLEQCNHQLSE